MTSDSGLIRVSADMVNLNFSLRMGLEDYLAGWVNGEETQNVITPVQLFPGEIADFLRGFSVGTTELIPLSE